MTMQYLKWFIQEQMKQYECKYLQAVAVTISQEVDAIGKGGYQDNDNTTNDNKNKRTLFKCNRSVEGQLWWQAQGGRSTSFIKPFRLIAQT